METLETIVGKRYGKLVVIAKSDFKGVERGTYWHCQCDCGGTKVCRRGSLTSGANTSCGCLQQATKFQNSHSKSYSKEYRAWIGMKTRCIGKQYQHRFYVQNGITVCKEWLHDFDKFYADMGDAPTRKHTIDRIDNLKGYYKENCRWATTLQQNRNYSQNRMASYNGKTQCVSAWAEEFKIARHVIYAILNKGLNLEALINTNKVSYER